jgi:two-component system invasion response regulator UvrY
MPRILLVDDHAVVRRGLREILAEQIPRVQFGEASSGPEALELISSKPWDLVILEVAMPGLSGLDVLKQIRQGQPKLPVLVFSVRPEAEIAPRAIKSGASGFMSKRSSAEALADGAKKLLAGRKYVSPYLAEKLAEDLSAGHEKPLHDSLSNREYEVLRLLGAGKRPAEVAEELSLSPRTISTYRIRILEKMRMKTSAQLVRYAIQHGLAD